MLDTQKNLTYFSNYMVIGGGNTSPITVQDRYEDVLVSDMMPSGIRKSIKYS